jgi:hypothetical protein
VLDIHGWFNLPGWLVVRRFVLHHFSPASDTSSATDTSRVQLKNIYTHVFVKVINAYIWSLGIFHSDTFSAILTIEHPTCFDIGGKRLLCL